MTANHSKLHEHGAKWAKWAKGAEGPKGWGIKTNCIKDNGYRVWKGCNGMGCDGPKEQNCSKGRLSLYANMIGTVCVCVSECVRVWVRGKEYLCEWRPERENRWKRKTNERQDLAATHCTIGMSPVSQARTATFQCSQLKTDWETAECWWIKNNVEYVGKIKRKYEVGELCYKCFSFTND